VIALARDGAAWPAPRLKAIRNAFFHYFRLDRAAERAGRLPIHTGLDEAADLESSLVIEPGHELSGIRAVFAYEVAIRTLTADYEAGELERLITALAALQYDLNRFAQAALARYLNERPDGVVSYEETQA
jgi:hypothetical protein